MCERPLTFATPAADAIAVANSCGVLALPPQFTNSVTFRLIIAAYVSHRDFPPPASEKE